MELRQLQELSHPAKARILAYLAENPGKDSEDLSDSLEIPLSTIYKYLRDLHHIKLIRPRQEASRSVWHVSKFKILLTAKDLPELVSRRPDYVEIFRQAYGEEAIQEALHLVHRAREGELTLRQAASKSELSYHEFVLLADSKSTESVTTEGLVESS